MNTSSSNIGPTITIVIVEDVPEFRESLVLALNAEPDMEVIAWFHSAEDLFQSEEIVNPRIVLMDINLPLMSGIEAVMKVKKQRPDIDVMMLTVFDDEDRIFCSLRAGASGYVLKSAPMTEILSSIRAIASGGASFTPRIARRVLSIFQPLDEPDRTELTDREKQILDLVSLGKSSHTIGIIFNLRAVTIDTHVKNIYKKLQLHSKRELLAWVMEQRLRDQ